MEKSTNKKYNRRLTDQILWQNRKIYINLLEEYLSSKIDAEEVVDKFFVFYRNHHNESEGLWAHPEKLKKIEIISKSEGFTDLIEVIFSACEALDVEETDDNSNYPLSENSFRHFIGLDLQKLKKYD